MNDKSDRPGQGPTGRDQCMVQHCSADANKTWTTMTEWRDWNVEWPVCLEHYRRLQADETWVPVPGQPPTWQRWILMGDDIPSLAMESASW